MTAIRWFLFLWCCGYLLCAGCAHRYARTDTATRTEETASTWETRAESAVEQKRSEETKKSVKRVRETFRPDGTLLSRLTEQADSDGRVLVDTSASASASATGADFRSVVASSSSTRASSTETRLPWFRIGAGVALVALGVYLFLRWRARRLRLV